MSSYTLRVLSSLMNGTEKQIAAVLAERQAEIPYGFLSYGGAYRALRRHSREPDRACEALRIWRDDLDISPHVQAFRRNAYSNLVWCAECILPRIVRNIESLEGDRGRRGKPLELSGELYTGGFHALVEWEDGTERLLYLLGPQWTRKRIKNMLTLLQMKAQRVYGRSAQSVVIVDIKRREVHELQVLSRQDQNLALTTAEWLRRYLRGSQAA